MNQLATYSLGTVLRETGINADTLRAWERRYKLPTPQRTEGGHRLYSERDVEIIKWLIRQQSDGMRIGEAVKLWRNKIDSGEDPLYESGMSTRGLGDKADISQIEGFRKRWVDACLDFNEVRAEQVANDAFTRFSPEVAFLEIFLPSIREIGQRWYEGNVTVQQEHFASGLLMRRLDALITTSPPPTRSERILIACPPKEEHTLSALLLTLFLRRRGFQVVYLGKNVPLQEFQETVETIQPKLIILTAQQLKTAATLEEIVRALSPSGVTIGYSGGVFNTLPALREHMSGEFLGGTFDDLFINVEALLRKSPVVMNFREESPYQALLDSFDVAHIAIHAHLNESLAKLNFPMKQMSESTAFLNEAIVASLYLGNFDLLSHELIWVKSLLGNRDVEDRLGHYLRAYAHSASETMGEIAEPLVDWLETQSVIYAQPETPRT